jgi:hypothetical protein
MNKILILTVVIIGGFIIAGNWYISANTTPHEFGAIDNISTREEDINNYDDCVAAGYPVMESLPEQCATDGGRIFTNTNAQLPPTNGIAEGEPYGESAPQTDGETIAIEAVRVMAAKDFGYPSNQIQITTVSSEDWPDGCLGLPDDDEMCVMMITSGYEISVTVNGKTATYRTNQNGTMVKRALY